jgi:hypothetical protein
MASTAMKGKIALESPVQPNSDGVGFHLTLPAAEYAG